MKVIVDINLADFQAWQGGKQNLNRIVELGLADEVQQFIEEIYPDGIDETQLNEYLWFQAAEEFNLWGDRPNKEEACKGNGKKKARKEGVIISTPDGEYIEDDDDDDDDDEPKWVRSRARDEWELETDDDFYGWVEATGLADVFMAGYDSPQGENDRRFDSLDAAKAWVETQYRKYKA